MTRIISGLAGGRRLVTPTAAGTRPTSDRVREALFSRLEHLDVLRGAAVLDLYAGSGALGLEAASRGAASVVLVESAPAAVRAARRNVAALPLSGVRVAAETVERLLLGGPGGPGGWGRADLVLADPPYELGEDEIADVLALLVQHRWLSDDGCVVVERASRSPEPRWPAGLQLAGERRYGETKVWFADVVPPDPPEVA